MASLDETSHLSQRYKVGFADCIHVFTLFSQIDDREGLRKWLEKNQCLKTLKKNDYTDGAKRAFTIMEEIAKSLP